MSLKSTYREGHLRTYERATGQTVDVVTGGPQIINDFSSETEGFKDSSVNGSVSAIVNGELVITTGAADDDDHDFTSQLIFDPSKGLTAEVSLSIANSTGCAFNFGFSDAITEAADKIAVTYSGTTLTSNADDFAGFFHDPDATTDRIRAVAINGSTDGSIAYTSTGTIASSSEHSFRVVVGSTGNCIYFHNNTQVGTSAAGIDPSATVCAYFGLINRKGASNTANLNYFNAWQHRAST